MTQSRRGILDDVKRGEICAILAVGGSRRTAARYVGCAASTIRNTAKRDEDFMRAILQAESKHEVLHLSYINSAAKDGRYWRAAAWALERKYPNRWAQRDPRQFTLEQVFDLLAQFANVVLEYVDDRLVRKRIIKRLGELAAELRKVPRTEKSS